MGKKGKGSGKKGKRKGGKKKAAEPQMTWKEALLAYQINIKERQLEDAKYEFRAVEEKNARHKERNERLQAEQMYYMKTLLKQAKDFEKKLHEDKNVEKNEVVEVMKDKWQAQRNEEDSIRDHEHQIAMKEVEIVGQKKQVTYWNEYRDRGADEHSKQIKLLKQELIDMQNSHDEMAAHLTKALKKSKVEIEETTGSTLSRQKHLASEKAMAKMDKNSRQEVLDNDWLKHEVEIHRREADDLLEKVERLEKENLQVMSELFECTVEDLKISRNFFLTQFEEGGENLEESGILEMDLHNLAINNLSTTIPDKPMSPVTRPKSATQKYVEDKVFSMAVVPTGEPNDDTDRELAVEGESAYDGRNELDSDDEDPFNNYYHFDDEDFDDYLQLGPLELKLLNITGKRMPIYAAKALTAEEEVATTYTTEHYPRLHLKES